ncbi:tail fiber domain-containing protein [bacterium]|nr:tail fiber domain-containing protein [bacterium]
MPANTRTLMTRSAGQEQLKEEYNNLKAAKEDAQSAYRAAKRERPQDIEKVRNARANLEDAKGALKMQRLKNKEFNNAEKARVYGEGQSKQDTLDMPTNPDNPVADGGQPGDAPKESKAKKFFGAVAKDARDFGKGVASSGMQLSQAFYDGVAGAIRGTNRNALDAAAATAQEQASNQRNEAANRQMESQASQQIANRNEYSEAGKIASVQNDAENRQNISNTSFAAGTASAINRKTNAPDVQSQQARQDQQRNVANQRREEMDMAQQGATEYSGLADSFNIKSRQMDADKAYSANMSAGGSAGQAAEQNNAEQNEQAAEQDWQNNIEQSGQNNPEAQPGQGSMSAAELDAFTRIKQGIASDADLQLFRKYTEQQLVEMGFGPKSIEAIFWQKGQDTQDSLNKIRERDDNPVSDESDDDPMSDERVKNIIGCLSDIRCKHIKSALESGGEMTPEDFMFLAMHSGGKFNNNGREYNFFDDDDWSDDEDGSVLDGYGKFIRNYLYTYKPEATEIDSRIDPNEEHIGPMAQDIEKVNPACIKETPEGVKTVDTQRLSMMNAGAIGDLVRELDDLKDRLLKLGV